jgi:hypothetical protein
MVAVVVVIKVVSRALRLLFPPLIPIMAMGLLVVTAIPLPLAMVPDLLVAAVILLPPAMVLDRLRLALFQQDTVMGGGSNDRKAVPVGRSDRC